MSEILEAFNDFNADPERSTTALFATLPIVLISRDSVDGDYWTMKDYLEGRARAGDVAVLRRNSASNELDRISRAFEERANKGNASVRYVESFIGPIDKVESEQQLFCLFTLSELKNTALRLAHSLGRYFGHRDKITCINQKDRDSFEFFGQMNWTDGGLIGWAFEKRHFDYQLKSRIEVVL